MATRRGGFSAGSTLSGSRTKQNEIPQDIAVQCDAFLRLWLHCGILEGVPFGQYCFSLLDLQVCTHYDLADCQKLHRISLESKAVAPFQSTTHSPLIFHPSWQTWGILRVGSGAAKRRLGSRNNHEEGVGVLSFKSLPGRTSGITPYCGHEAFPASSSRESHQHHQGNLKYSKFVFFSRKSSGESCHLQ